MSGHHPAATPVAAPTAGSARERDGAIARDTSNRDRAMLEIARQLATAIPLAHEPDLTVRQLFVLHLLSEEPRAIGVIAKELGITISSASGLVDRLETAGLIRRVHPAPPEDRRRVICHLTPSGTTALTDHLLIGNLRLEVLLAELSADEIGLVEQAMELLLRAAREVIARAKVASADPPADPPADR
jgi:DNA-binding MarR family transcriptional regulator